MTNQQICDAIVELLHDLNLFRVHHGSLPDVDAPLTGKDFQMTGVQLAYLFFAVEDRFDITLRGEDVENNGFLSIRRIADGVSTYLH